MIDDVSAGKLTYENHQSSPAFAGLRFYQNSPIPDGITLFSITGKSWQPGFDIHRTAHGFESNRLQYIAVNIFYYVSFVYSLHERITVYNTRFSR